MPEDFAVVAEWDKRCSLGQGNNTRTREKLFANAAGLGAVRGQRHEQITFGTVIGND
jgi:hypothetical protein